MSDRYNKAPELTAEKAYKLYNQDGLSYAQIAEQFSNDEESISHTTVRNRVQAYDTGKEAGKEEVLSDPQSYDLVEEIDDEEGDINPYETTTCPACGTDMPKPDNAGVHSCPDCNTDLEFKEHEL